MPKRRMKRVGRKRGRLYPQIKRIVGTVVTRYPGASTHEVAARAGISWSTANKYLRALRREEKVKSRKRGKKTLWY